MTSTDNTQYYDAFSQSYDRGRDRGYHKLIDDQAAAIVKRVGQGGRLLEVGCGTGLVMERVSQFARDVEGIDISPGMLEHARRRGLSVREGSATELPFGDNEFDVVYSFKVLAHVGDIDTALSEMARVTRPGGHVVFDNYNRHSMRYLIKRVFGPRKTSNSFDEGAIGTRFDSVDEALARARRIGTVVHADGIRVVTPHPVALRVPVVAQATEWLEWKLMRSALHRFAGFVVFTTRVDG